MGVKLELCEMKTSGESLHSIASIENNAVLCTLKDLVSKSRIVFLHNEIK